MKLKIPKILNSQGEAIKLNAKELHTCKYLANALWEKHGPTDVLENALGYDIVITTLTTIAKKISEQKFYKIPFADYLPVVVGEGAYSDFITTYRSFQIGGSFAEGVLNMGGNNARLAAVSAGVDALQLKIFPWAKALGFSIMELEYAAKSGNWDLVAALEESRKTNWDLGLQEVAFLGLQGQNGATGLCQGLLNLAGVVPTAGIITKPISTMTPSELKAFQTSIIPSYRAQTNRSAWPNRLTIPESDYLGLQSQSSPDFPVKSVLQLLEEGFKGSCGADFQILKCAYADASEHSQVSAIAGKQCYALYNADEKSLKMEVPLAYTTTTANSLDNFGFQNVGFGQFSGVIPLRPLEIQYFQF